MKIHHYVELEISGDRNAKVRVKVGDTVTITADNGMGYEVKVVALKDFIELEDGDLVPVRG